MSSTYGTSKTVTIPSDGDTIDAVDVNVPIAAMWDEHDVLADITALRAILVPTHGLVRFVRGYGHYVFVTSGTYSASTANSPWITTATDGTAGRWVLDLTADSNKQIVRSFACANANPLGCAKRAKSYDISTTTVWYPLDWDSNSSVAADSRYYFEWNQVKFSGADSAAALGQHAIFQLNPYLVNGATLDSVKLILGGQGHGALPLMMPALGVVRYEPVANTLDTLRASGMLDDTSANAAAYDAIHDITLTTDQNQTIDLSTYVYFAVVCNEGHTNALAELRLRQIVLTMTTKGYLL